MNLMKQREMSASEYLIAIAKLGLNQAEAGRFLMVSERTARRYCSGDTEVPAAVAMLLRLMIKQGIEVKA